MAEAVVRIEHLTKRFGDLEVLRDVSMEVDRGEVVVIFGRSGSGKSTLLRCVNFLEDPTSGAIEVAGMRLEGGHRTRHKLERIRQLRTRCGMVFQQFNLFPHLTVLENCTLAPIWVRSMPRREAEDIAMEYLRRVRIPEQAAKYPGQLSGGQQQRVAIARAIVTQPSVLLADEPTGNLDAATGAGVIDLLFELNAEHGTTLVLVTHDNGLAARCSRVIRLAGGRIVAD